MNAETFKKSFKAMDKITLKDWPLDYYWEVLFIGEKRFFYKDQSGEESSTLFGNDWLPFIEPKKTKLVPIALVDTWASGYTLTALKGGEDTLNIVIKQPNGVEIEGLCYLKVEE